MLKRIVLLLGLSSILCACSAAGANSVPGASTSGTIPLSSDPTGDTASGNSSQDIPSLADVGISPDDIPAPVTAEPSELNLFISKSLDELKDIAPGTGGFRSECVGLYSLLTALELYPDSEMAEDILDIATNRVTRLMDTDITDSDLPTSDIYLASGALAKYARLAAERSGDTKNSDIPSNALSTALSVYELAQAYDAPDPEERALAAIELYRHGSLDEGLSFTEAYLGSLDFGQKSHLMDFLTATSYLNTHGDVDVELSGRIMTGILRETEKFAIVSGDAPYMAPEYPSDEIPKALLEDMLRLSVANYVIKNHEYDTLLVGQVHYLYGRNADIKDHSEEIRSSYDMLAMLISSLMSAV